MYLIFLSTVPLWDPAQGELVFCANLACPFPFIQVSHLTLGNSLACFSFRCEERPRQVQPLRWNIAYCLSDWLDWIVFSLCFGLAEWRDQWSKGDEPFAAPCESSNFCDSWLHLQHWKSAQMWKLPFNWWFCGLAWLQLQGPSVGLNKSLVDTLGHWVSQLSCKLFVVLSFPSITQGLGKTTDFPV